MTLYMLIYIYIVTVLEHTIIHNFIHVPSTNYCIVYAAKNNKYCSNSWNRWWSAWSTGSPCNMLPPMVSMSTHNWRECMHVKKSYFTLCIHTCIQTIVGGVVQKEQEVKISLTTLATLIKL